MFVQGSKKCVGPGRRRSCSVSLVVGKYLSWRMPCTFHRKPLWLYYPSAHQFGLSILFSLMNNDQRMLLTRLTFWVLAEITVLVLNGHHCSDDIYGQFINVNGDRRSNWSHCQKVGWKMNDTVWPQMWSSTYTHVWGQENPSELQYASSKHNLSSCRAI